MSDRAPRSTPLLLLVTAALLAPAAPAGADTVSVADPTIQNVTAYATTSAWSRRADDGTHRLVVATAGVAPADANVRSSSVAFDPDLGPTSDNKRLIVYSRCAKGSATKGCDIYAYDITARSERKVSAVSSSRASEVGPSFFKGAIAFGRLGGESGLYVAPFGKGAKRINIARAFETDLSATRVIARLGSGSQTSMLLAQPSGDRARIVDQAGRVNGASNGPRLTSPVLARYRAFWLEQMPRTGTSITRTVSVRRVVDVASSASRPFAVVANGLALGPNSMPRLYSGPAGIATIDPALVFGS